MKLRDFVANSLPRVRGRKKKGQAAGTTGAPVSITAAAAAAAAATVATGSSTANARSLSVAEAEEAEEERREKGLHSSLDVRRSESPRSSRRQDGGHGHWFSFSESRLGFLERLVGKDSPVKRLLETKERRHAVTSPPPREKRPQEQHYHHNKKRSSSSRVCPSSATEPSSPYGGSLGGVRSPPLGEKPVFHSQHASPVSASWAAREERYSDWDCSSLYAGVDGGGGYGYGYGYGYPESLTSFSSTPGSQRGPRSRSRIRTNPWLPSPRPSPYSVRSLSSPCTSSRSPSPSSSPAPPSSSDSTSPLTSFSSDVNGTTHDSQLQRHRRHRRHHSEVKASDLTRHFVFDPSLTDTEQYYSTLDSGIGDTAASSGEKDKQKVASSRKQRNLNSKRKTVEKDSELVKTVASSSPKSKPKFRAKNRASHPSSSSKGRIANRDSKFWDSDSSSRSPPPRTSRSLGTSKDSLHFDSFPSENCANPNRNLRLPGTPIEAGPGYLHVGDLFCVPDSVDFGPIAGSSSHKSPLLSPSDDICIITSNIEQLAQNISSEYEEGLDVSFGSMLHSSSKEGEKRASLRDLLNLDVENALISNHLEADLCTRLDYSSFAGPLQCRQLSRSEERASCDTLQSSTSPSTPQPDTSLSEDTPTVDVAVQTDFADDEEEEDISGSDWLASTESGSDWVTSNGSGSDWPISGGSDWQVGEGSGCATEEEEEEEKEVEEEEEESTLWVEGSRLWIVPDIMQNSTDTGYSSLSRDGRIVTDDNNNHNNNNNNNSSNNSNDNNRATHPEDSSDSSSATTTTDEKMSKTSDSDVTKSESLSCPSTSDAIVPEVIPKSSARQKLSTRAPLPEDFDTCGDPCAQRISCKLEFSIVGGNCSCPKNSASKEKYLLPSRMSHKSGNCWCDVDVSGDKNTQEAWQPKLHQSSSKARLERRHTYDHVVPYPYDVRRFSDVTLPYDEREGSVSPSFPDSTPSGSEEADQQQHGPLTKPALFTSTPRHHMSEPEDDDDDDFRPRFSSLTSMTSERHDVTDHDAGAQSSPEERSQPCRSSPGMAVLLRSRGAAIPLRSCEDMLPGTGRALQEVRDSLEDKVHVLRQGKRLVSRKIREAREEEMVRQQQKLRFQRLLDIHRKRILLETLQELRQKLESQSARLQASYSAVLNLQKRYV
ncbi:uncharacterized protein LOC143291235 [Babylonia areolata]|uniref:uncharacterized protein LOC143291235 n=1 Tax=Babylonia areolata TaxID=304850 RepID=UPI003FD4DB5E